VKGDDLMQAAAGDTDYESSGHGYERHRRPDPRIGALIHQHLGAGPSVVNVGAGAGSYEPADRCVFAVEPSAAMHSHRSFTEAVPAINAAAEALPFDDASIDAAMAIFTVHQWADPARGLAELRRVTRGLVVVMTLDIETLSGFWLGEYLPERLAAEQNRFPPLRQPRRKSSSDACRARYASVLRLQPAGCPLCKRAPLNGAPPSGSLAAGWLLPASRWDRRVGSRPDQRCRPIAIAPSFTGRQAESVVTEVSACGLSRVENRALMGTQSG